MHIYSGASSQAKKRSYNAHSTLINPYDLFYLVQTKVYKVSWHVLQDIQFYLLKQKGKCSTLETQMHDTGNTNAHRYQNVGDMNRGRVKYRVWGRSASHFLPQQSEIT